MNLKVLHRHGKVPLLDLTFFQLMSVLAPYLSKTHFNILLPSARRYGNWYTCSQISNKNLCEFIVLRVRSTCSASHNFL
jgi:hypothetical protein